MKGKTIEYSNNDVNSAVKKIVAALLEKNCIDAVLAPKRIPSKESFAYELTQRPSDIAGLDPIPPVMPINGARALKQLTHKGPFEGKMLCIMRPCEIRASAELSKLRQVDLTNIMFLSIDCPGAMPTKHYLTDPAKYDTAFLHAWRTFRGEGLRPACTTCLHFGMTNVPSDFHIALLGLPDNTLMAIPGSEKGAACLKTIGLDPTDDATTWQHKSEEQRTIRQTHRNTSFSTLAGKTSGIDNLDAFFADCINCHNCMRVCPICYCRQCFFDSSDTTRIEAQNYLDRADAKGGITLPADKLLFHLGRMSHMSLSCVGCGACEDACAMDVPVAQIFVYMADKAQTMFDYIAGRSISEDIPVLTYQENELHDYEDAKERS